ncbi:MAG: hypothetical protein E7E64_02360 [Clostridium celatum]|nr:hypothetical protein [Clostridium celatum]MDU4978584.1 hypothetical protein [Clostridium celatum]
MLEKYEGIIRNKEEIKKYLAILNEKKQLPKENELIYITKLILFNKSIFVVNDRENTHYKNYMVYNVLMLMHSLTKDSKINFYQLYRSLIENILRIMLNLEDRDETGVNELFRRFSEKYECNEIGKEFTNFIKGEYSEACNYVHSNIRAGVDVYLFYSEILASDEMDNQNIIKLIFIMKTFLFKFTKFIVNVEPTKIEATYYRKHEELKHLIGENLYLDFKRQIDEI